MSVRRSAAVILTAGAIAAGVFAATPPRPPSGWTGTIR